MAQPFKQGSKIEKAHPLIAPLMKRPKLTPMEFRARVLKAGVRVLKRIERHLMGVECFDRVPAWCQRDNTTAIAVCRGLRSQLIAELEGRPYTRNE